MPPVEPQIVGVPAIAGIDTRTDGTSVRPPNLIDLRNASFRSPGQIQPRYGFQRILGPSGAGSYTAARALLTRNGQAILDADGGTTYGLKELPGSNSTWKSISNAWPYVTSYQTVDTVSIFADVAYVGTRRYVALEWTTNGSATHRISILGYDSNGNYNSTSFRLSSPTFAPSKPRLLAIGNTLVLLYIYGTTGIAFVTIDTNIQFPVSVVTGTSLVADINATNPVYDAEVIGGRIYIAYNSSTANTIKHAIITPAGTVDVGFTNITTANAPVAVAVATNVNGGVTGGDCALMWAIDANTSVNAQWFTANALADLGFGAKALSTALPGAVKNLTGAFDGNGGNPGQCPLHVFVETSGGLADLNQVHRAILAQTGDFCFDASWMRHAGLGSKPWGDRADVSRNSFGSGLTSVHVGLVHDSTLQRCYFTAASQNVCLAGSLGGASGLGFAAGFDPMITGLMFGQEGAGLMPNKHLPRVASPGSRVYSTIMFWKPQATGGAYPAVVTMDFSKHPDHVQAGQSIYVPGGLLWEIDGKLAHEADFLLYPEGTTAASSTTGGSLLPNTSYSYEVFFEYINSNGEHRVSSTSSAVTITTGGAHDTVTLTIRTIAATNRPLVSLAVYRQEQGGTLFHRVSSADVSAQQGVANGVVLADAISQGLDTVTFIDKMSEATLLSQEVSPLTGGVIDNIAPSSPSLITAGNGRVFLSGFADQNMIWFSKIRETLEPLSFNDAFTILVEQGRGPITALATMQDTLVIFRETQTYLCGGDGPDNTNASGAFGTPRLVSDGIGCANPRSIVQLPTGGIMFQSRQGIYAYTGVQGSLEFVGAKVEAITKTATCIAAVAVTDAHEIRFQMSNGQILVYDYLMEAWGIWDLATIDGRMIGNAHVVLTSDTGVTLRETSGIYLDDGKPFTFVMELPWIYASDMQGMIRLLSIMAAGDYKSPHSLIVKLQYNMEEGFAESRTWNPITAFTGVTSALGIPTLLFGNKGNANPTFGSSNPQTSFGGAILIPRADVAGNSAIPGSQYYQVQIKPSRQKISAIKVRLESAPPVSPSGDPSKYTYNGLSFGISEIAFEIGVLPGTSKVGSVKRVP